MENKKEKIKEWIVMTEQKIARLEFENPISYELGYLKGQLSVFQFWLNELNKTNISNKRIAFKVGDKVRIAHISDNNPHNGKIGTVIWLRGYDYYTDDGANVKDGKVQGKIIYDDGTTENFSNLYQSGCVVVHEEK